MDVEAKNPLLDLLESEPAPIVRAVLGHWLFGFIHPYMRERPHGAVPDEPDDGLRRVSMDDRADYAQESLLGWFGSGFCGPDRLVQFGLLARWLPGSFAPPPGP